MKTKLLSLLFCLFVLCSLSHAQKTSFLIDMSAGMNQSHKTSMSLRGMFSYSINEHVALGAGTGIWYNYRESTQYQGYSDFSLELPVFVNVRGNILKNNGGVTPYYSVSAGLLNPIKKAKYEYSYRDEMINDPTIYFFTRENEYDKGFFVAPELGIVLNDMSFGVEFMYGPENCIDTKEELHVSGAVFTDSTSTINGKSYVISLKFTIGF
ncbi:MAG: hypothetical protein IJZ87_05380 [Bacteroidales bacterium]|nr:hypothetical protein [Bacteroidales bacterium]